MSGIVNKIEAQVEKVLHPHKETTTTTTTTHHGTGAPEGTYGPHSSKIANAADPRVDSDADRHHAGGVGTTTHGTAHGGLGGNHGAGAHSGYTGTTYGSAGLTGSHGSVAHSGLTGTTGTTHHTATHAGSGSLTGHTGTAGGISDSTNAGPHNSNLANKMDPRVDSDLSGSGNRHGATTGHGIMGASGSHATPGSGTAQNTAGPHNSDIMNQLDPRVDADLDGSKTIGGNKTYR